MKNSIVVSVTAHPDDEVLGFGATCAKLAANGNKVYNCILSKSADARRYRPDSEILFDDTELAQKIMGCEPPILGDFPNIKFNTIPHLELVQFIEKVIEEIKPDYIFTHSPYDLNDDHLHVSKACQAASRLSQRKPGKRIKGLYFMEIPSSTDWAYSFDGNSFKANTFVEINQEFLDIKLKALNQYTGVMRPFPHPRSTEAITGLAAYRGAQSGSNYAEAFQCVFNFLDI